MTLVLNNRALIGHRRYYDFVDAVPQLAEELCVNVYSSNISAYIRYNAKVMIETSVDKCNELNFSDVHPSVNYFGALANVTKGFILFARNPMYKPQKNEIYSLNIFLLRCSVNGQ